MAVNEKKFILDMLKKFADTVVSIFSRSCEVAIHDLTELKNSLVYIAGDVTKRQPGAPITDLVVKKLREEGDAIKDMYNYKTTLKDGRILRSSTVFFRKNSGKVVAAFCINIDTTDFMNSIKFLENFIRFNDVQNQIKKETFASSVNETIKSLVEQAIDDIGKQPPSMATEERIQFVKLLEQKGAFLIKGALDQIAIIMGLSKYTVYSYLQKIRAANSMDSF